MSLDYVQYGCGWCAPEGWRNFDASATLRFERFPLLGRLYTKNARRFPSGVRYGDIVRGLPVAPESCAGIYCSHVLEHLAYEDCRVALARTFQYLRPGGTFRLVVPDLESLARGYLADEDAEAAHRFMDASVLGVRRRASGPWGWLRQWLGKSAHLWLWDEKSMAKELAEHGFRDIRRAHFGDAEDRKFDEVEDKERFDGCLAMQCRR